MYKFIIASVFFLKGCHLNIDDRFSPPSSYTDKFYGEEKNKSTPEICNEKKENSCSEENKEEKSFIFWWNE